MGCTVELDQTMIDRAHRHHADMVEGYDDSNERTISDAWRDVLCVEEEPGRQLLADLFMQVTGRQLNEVMDLEEGFEEAQDVFRALCAGVEIGMLMERERQRVHVARTA